MSLETVRRRYTEKNSLIVDDWSTHSDDEWLAFPPLFRYYGNSWEHFILQSLASGRFQWKSINKVLLQILVFSLQKYPAVRFVTLLKPKQSTSIDSYLWWLLIFLLIKPGLFIRTENVCDYKRKHPGKFMDNTKHISPVERSFHCEGESNLHLSWGKTTPLHLNIV